MERVAQCHCGSLRAHVTGDTERINICHCKACQRRTGALFHAGAFYSKSQVRIEGDRKAYARPADSGRTVTFFFCPNCGTNLYIENEILPDHVGISIGTFADPTFPEPRASVWEESRHPWISVPAETQRFQQSRADPAAIIARMRPT